MAKIDELLQELCPDGVEWKTFSDCCSYIRGVTYNKSQESKSDDGVKVLRANNITLSNNSLNFADVKVVDNSVKIKDSQWLKQSDILICAGSGSKEHIGKVAFVPNDLHYTFGGFMGVIRSKSFVQQSYLFHLLKSTIFSDYLNASLNSSTINNLSTSIMSNFSFPLPPIPIQQQIVEVLDTFTDAISNLEEELALREKQFEYYQDTLLNFDDETKFISFGESFQLKARIGWQGLTKKEYRSEGNYKLVTGTDFTDNHRIDFNTCVFVDKDRYDQDKYIQLKNDDVLITKDGTLGKIAYIENLPYPTTLNGGVFVVRNITGELLQKFTMHYLASSYFKTWISSNHTTGSIKHLTQKLLVKFNIPVPPIERQQEIVEILDTFESMIANIKEEIALRTKQYEYYREKLLSFGK